VRDIVDVVEEEPAFAEEIHRVLRMRAQRNAEVEHPRRRKSVAAGDIPEREAGAEERAATQIFIELNVDEYFGLVHFVLGMNEADRDTRGAGGFPVVGETLGDTKFQPDER